MFVVFVYKVDIIINYIYEEESRKEAHEKWTDGTKIRGEMELDGERRNTYSAAVVDGCERTSTIYVGDSIVRKTDTRLGKGKDVVVCSFGREGVREGRRDGGRKGGRQGGREGRRKGGRAGEAGREGGRERGGVRER